jgi:phosphatidylserine/phosphatidylglycerophosphate/cardiolipin synthase-like enzyme
VRDQDVATAYLRYWEELHEDPEMKEIRPWNEEIFPIPDGLPAVGTGAAFSPRSSLDLLNWYARLMDQANSAVFLTAAFGVNDLFEEVLEHPKPYLRYVLLESADRDMDLLNGYPLNEVAVANILPQNEFERWMEEHLTGLNVHVKYVHTKYMIIDPLGEDPLVITGSANFSDASTRKNDENMLVIRGDRRVADIYLSEFMRLFNHFQFRGLARARGATGPESARSFLVPDDSWKDRYYQPGTPKYLERLYFAGHP